MDFQTPLVRGTLVQRYKRFLADVTLESGETVTAHCANPGAMLGVSDPGAAVWLEPVANPARKLKYSWRLIELPGGHLAGIDTSVPNRVVGEALRAGAIPELERYRSVRAEVPYAEASRVDFLGQADGEPDCYIEVKNVHLRRSGALAEFPDCVTARGARHLGDLADVVEMGYRAVMLYLVQRDDCDAMALASDLDPGYANAARKASATGVEMLCYAAELSIRSITLGRKLPVSIPA